MYCTWYNKKKLNKSSENEVDEIWLTFSSIWAPLKPCNNIILWS